MEVRNVPIKGFLWESSLALAKAYLHEWSWFVDDGIVHEGMTAEEISSAVEKNRTSCFPGISEPSVYRGCHGMLEHRHSTGTGRTTWIVREDGYVDISISRPSGVVIRATIPHDENAIEIIRHRENGEIHYRHIVALCDAIVPLLSMMDRDWCDEVLNSTTIERLWEEALRTGDEQRCVVVPPLWGVSKILVPRPEWEYYKDGALFLSTEGDLFLAMDGTAQESVEKMLSYSEEATTGKQVCPVSVVDHLFDGEAIGVWVYVSPNPDGTHKVECVPVE